MERIKLSLLVISAISISSLANANTLSDALVNGKVTGDVSATYESRKQDKEVSIYYSNTAYSVGSIGLNYKTASFNDFTGEVGFRAYSKLYEDDSNFKTYHGTGDSTERFYDEKGSSMLSRANIAYDIDSLHVKVGRQLLSDDWLTNVHDAVTVNANPIDNLDLELIYSERFGRARARDLRPMTDTNDNNGIYKTGLTYKFNDLVKSNAFYYAAPDSYDMYGGKLYLDKEYSDVKVGTSFHMLELLADKDPTKDGELLELKAYVSIDGYTGTLGYVDNKKADIWGTAGKAGFNIVPFEEGDSMLKADAKTTYFMLSKNIAGVSLTGLYGIFDYGKYKSSEFDIWAGYDISKNAKFNLGYAMTVEDDDDTSMSDMQQLNATLTYSF